MDPQVEKGGGYSNPQMAQYGFQGQPTQCVVGQPQQYGDMPPPYSNYPVVVQPVAMGGYVVEPKPWSSGVCDCFSDVGICFQGWCGAFCYANDIAESIGAPPVDCFFFKKNVGDLRTQVRARFNIKGDPGNDYVVAQFCLACSLCQMGREIKQQGLIRS